MPNIRRLTKNELATRLEAAIDYLEGVQWTGIDAWCVEECGGCVHHGHNKGCWLAWFIEDNGLGVKWNERR